MIEQIEQLRQRGPNCSMLIEFDKDVAWQMQRVTSEVHAERRLLAFTEVPNAIALTCWLHKSALIAALDREIDSEADAARSAATARSRGAGRLACGRA
jgi:hypothetical protein